MTRQYVTMLCIAGIVSLKLGYSPAIMAQISAPLTVASETRASVPVQPPPVVPLTVPDRGVSSAAVPDVVPDSAAQTPERVGDVTRRLLAHQAEVQRPGTPHEVLGVTAGRSWQRYLDSFEHPIPDRFENEVDLRRLR